MTLLKNAPVTFLSPNNLMLGGNASATTDANGRYTFSNVAVDGFTLQAVSLTDPISPQSADPNNPADPYAFTEYGPEYYAAKTYDIANDVIW